MVRKTPDVFKRVEYLLTTGNLNSATGLGLMQASIILPLLKLIAYVLVLCRQTGFL
jgi:hypothetical protein